MSCESKNKQKNYFVSFTDFTPSEKGRKRKVNKLVLIFHRKTRGLTFTKSNAKLSKIWGKSGKYCHKSIQFHYSSLEC